MPPARRRHRGGCQAAARYGQRSRLRSSTGLATCRSSRRRGPSSRCSSDSSSRPSRDPTPDNGLQRRPGSGGPPGPARRGAPGRGSVHRRHRHGGALREAAAGDGLVGMLDGDDRVTRMARPVPAHRQRGSRWRGCARISGLTRRWSGYWPSRTRVEHRARRPGSASDA